MSGLRVAVVGLGAIGIEHATIYATATDAELAAVVDPRANQANVYERWPGTRLHGGLDDVLADDSIDAVSLCTPDDVHFADAEKVMRAGRHLLLEKPIATDVHEASALVDLAENTGVVAMPGHTLRFEPRYHYAHLTVAAGVIGEVVHGYVRRNNRVSVAARANGRVNVAWFLGIHDIDALQWIAGANVTEVQARETRVRDASGCQAAAVMATLGFPSGALVQLEAAWCLPEASPTELDARFRLVGTAGEVSIDSFDSGIRVATDRFDLPMPTVAPMYGRAQGPLHEELASFVQCCLHGDPLPVTMREAAQAVMVVEAMSSAVSHDKTVAVGQL